MTRSRMSRIACSAVALVGILLCAHPVHAQPLFRFHNASWMNLHHYLHAQARASSPLIEQWPAAATVRDREQWTTAVEFYRSRFGRRSLLFDQQLLTVKQQLIAVESADALVAPALTPEHRQVLERVMPIYRRLWWDTHRAGNAAFIAVLQQRLARHGATIAERLARSYDDVWPAEGLRVDIVADAGPPGNAYTTNVPRPTHITMGAADEGLSSLELVFHESSHHWDQRLMKAVNDAAQSLNVRAPPDLWHAILFYNAGRITADALAGAGIPDYETYMVKGRVFARPGWHETIAAHWSSFLAGAITRDDAVGRIVRDLPGTKPGA